MQGNTTYEVSSHFVISVQVYLDNADYVHGMRNEHCYSGERTDEVCMISSVLGTMVVVFRIG